MTIGLGEISALRSIGRGVLAKNAQVVAKGEQLIEVADRIIDPADTGQRIDIPERADKKGALGKTNVVIMLIPVEKPVLCQQLFLQRRDMISGPPTLVIKVIHRDHRKRASIEVSGGSRLGGQ